MEETKRLLSLKLEDNVGLFKKLCKDCDDIVMRPMNLGKDGSVSCFTANIEVAVNNMVLKESVIGNFLSHLRDLPSEAVYKSIKEDGLGISDFSELRTMDEVLAALLAGNAIMFIDGYDKALKIASKGYPGMGITKAESEKVINGSRESFSESEKLNTALIRKRIRDTRLKVKEQTIGVRSHTMAALVYMEDLIYPDVLQQIQSRLKSFEIDGVFDSGMVEQLTEDTWYSLFPQFQMTERPDKAAMAILEGRIVLISDNSPMALILPTTYHSFFQTSDDYYNRFFIVSFLRILRHIAALLAMLLPGLYLAVTNFHTQVLPTNLILSFAAARSGVPFPSIVEVLLLELAFELLREAGLRMPGPIGGTIGIVGGLIIGQSAVTANLVSPIIVVVVAMTALCSFSIPNEGFSTAFRLIKFAMIFLCYFLGMYGLALGIFIVVTHLSKLKSFGIPYLMPVIGADLNHYQDEKDNLLRFPFFMLRKRPIYARRDQRTKLKIKK